MREGRPVVGEASGLHEAGLVRFLQQLLRERHEAGVLHQAPPLRHLRRQRFASFLPRRLQGLGEGGVALCQRRRQIPDALSQLLSGGDAVHLQTETKCQLALRSVALSGSELQELSSGANCGAADK